MSQSMDHLVETHRIAQKRRAAGLPIWDRQIDLRHIWQNEALSFEQRRDAIAAMLRRSPWVKDRTDLQELVDELADAETGDDFDVPWDALYDEADLDRVWIATF